MKTQTSKQHTHVVAVQPSTTSPKEDRMKTQSSTMMKLALFVAIVVAMAIPSMAATTNTV